MNSPGNLEAKVSLPAVVVACAAVLAGAGYTLARAYGFDPSPEQNTAIVGVGSAVQYVLYVIVGYLAPHTPRPDLPPTVPPAPQPVRAFRIAENSDPLTVTDLPEEGQRMRDEG